MPDETYMNAHIPMHTGAVETDVHAERNTRPSRVTSLTIKAHLGMHEGLNIRRSRLTITIDVELTLLPLPDFNTLKTCSVSALLGSVIFELNLLGLWPVSSNIYP